MKKSFKITYPYSRRHSEGGGCHLPRSWILKQWEKIIFWVTDWERKNKFCLKQVLFKTCFKGCHKTFHVLDIRHLQCAYCENNFPENN